MSRVTDVKEIDKRELANLEQGRTLVLRIEGFLTEATALALSEQLVRHPSLSVYRNTSELERVGESHYETHNADGSSNQEALDEYLDRADRLMNEIRDACLPYRSPLDQLWHGLAEVGGVERAAIGGRPMFAGVVRVFPESSELLPHNDIFARDAPGLAAANEISAQFAANIYLEVPEDGGNLEIWDERPTAGRLAEIQDPVSKYGALRDLLPPPDLEIHVRPGDLVLMDATKLHAVTPQKGGRRVGMSCFLGMRPGRPILIWS